MRGAGQSRISATDLSLARSFVWEIAPPFGDRNPRGSVSRVLRVIAEHSLQEEAMLCCLVHAYTVVRDTGQANRMPFFCMVFEQFAQACAQGKGGDYTWQQMEQDIAADDYLGLWWHRLQEKRKRARGGAPPSEAPGQKEGEGWEMDELRARWTSERRVVSWARYLQWKLREYGLPVEVRVCREMQWYYLVVEGEGVKTEIRTFEQSFQLMASVQGDADPVGEEASGSRALEGEKPAESDAWAAPAGKQGGRGARPQEAGVGVEAKHLAARKDMPAGGSMTRAAPLAGLPRRPTG